MKDFVELLVNQSKAERVSVTAALDDALKHLDNVLTGIAGDVQVEYFGPFVGVETELAHQMIIRAHDWELGGKEWSLKVCTTAPQSDFRPEWPIQGCGRIRKQKIVKALPAFFQGYAAAIAEAGKADTPAGKRIAALAGRFID